MRKVNILNVVIAGIGGQGVITLSNWIRQMAVNAGYTCEGASFKGGAQRMGSVYSELRILKNKESGYVFSSQIPKGEVDVLIGLEPWEALRSAKNCHALSHVLVNSVEEVLYVNRFSDEALFNPIEKLKELFINLKSEDFSSKAEMELGAKNNLNMMMLLEALERKLLPFSTTDFEKLIPSKG